MNKKLIFKFKVLNYQISHTKMEKELFFEVFGNRDLRKIIIDFQHGIKFDRVTGYIAAKNGYLNWILEMERLGIDMFFTKNAMDWAAKKGHLEVIKYLHEKRKEGCTTYAMNWAAGNGHLEVIKYLHEKRKEGCTIDAMNWAAKNGHLEVVKYLHEKRNEECTTDAMDYAARNGHLEIVVWLHENRTEGYTTNAMDWAAKNGHLKVVKYLRK
jgi:ankyrin repeat protein